MKRMLPLVFLLIAVASCDVYVAEPRYDYRDKLLGQYDAQEYSETYNQVTNYALYIRKTGYSREIIIDNFYASDIRVYAYVDYDKITIPFQVVNGFEVEGTGSVYNSSFNLHYRVKDTYSNSFADFCSLEAWKY